MRMVFQFAIDKGLIQNNPMMRINDPHLESILTLDKAKKNAVRAAFGKYGFRKRHLKELSQKLYAILQKHQEFENREGIRKNSITVREVYEQWYRNTQDGVLAENTSASAFHSIQELNTIPLRRPLVYDCMTFLQER